MPMSRASRRHIRILIKLVRDEDGGEMLEYALVAGLMIIGAIATITCVGQRVVARWNSLNTSI